MGCVASDSMQPNKDVPEFFGYVRGGNEVEFTILHIVRACSLGRSVGRPAGWLVGRLVGRLVAGCVRSLRSPRSASRYSQRARGRLRRNASCSAAKKLFLPKLCSSKIAPAPESVPTVSGSSNIAATPTNVPCAACRQRSPTDDDGYR